MPACDKVKDKKAPTANNGISRSVMPSKMTSRMAAVPASHRMPTELTSRRPEIAKARGRYSSRATWRQSRGNPAKLVLADRHSTAKTLLITTK